MCVFVNVVCVMCILYVVCVMCVVCSCPELKLFKWDILGNVITPPHSCDQTGSHAIPCLSVCLWQFNHIICCLCCLVLPARPCGQPASCVCVFFFSGEAGVSQINSNRSRTYTEQKYKHNTIVFAPIFMR